MTWLLCVFAPIVGLLAIWILAMVGEEKWEKQLDDEEWEE